jgi:hypothetical protein
LLQTLLFGGGFALPTVAGERGSLGVARGLVGRVGVLARLDGVLFEPSGWFVIDHANVRIPNVVVPSLSTGLGFGLPPEACRYQL